MKIIKNELPPKFETYCAMYDYMKDRIQPSHTEIKYAEHGINTVWEFNIDFIKARCFEEVVKFYPPEPKSMDYVDPDYYWDRYYMMQEFQKKTKIGNYF